MSLFMKLQKRADEHRPLRVGLIGAGKFGAMYLAQLPRTPGVHLAGIADLSPANARASIERVGWAPDRAAATSLDEALRHGTTHVGDDWRSLIRHPQVEIIIECTGSPIAAIEHCLAAFDNGKHVVNVTVEADALCGPYLAERARAAGVLYSLAYGDQPALACELVDWARACGFPVVAAGRGHKWLAKFRESTPDTVWDHWGVTAEQAKLGGMNPKMFNSFLDGSKPAIECAAIANVTGLEAPDDGLAFPPGTVDDIPGLMRLKSEGGHLDKKGVVEVISSLRPDGTPVGYDIRKGVWVCVEAANDYIQRCFKEYQVVTDPAGRNMVLYRKWHLIGLEVGLSVASVGLRGEATGAPGYFNADVVATAKRDLAAGEILDGEGGYTVFGKLCPARRSVDRGYLPLGLAHDVKLLRPVKKDAALTFSDVAVDPQLSAYQARKAMEKMFEEPRSAMAGR
ncbi:MAG TPA: Gfo/Idh/MocA family oxidoreductase [Stellaceae bacterium]|nr:Gfo/Idh/MocA family oxidoreductase [Stellaceae bacterium]